MLNISRSNVFGKFVLIVYFNQQVLQPRPRGVAKEKEMKKQKETEKKDEQSLLHE